VRQIGMRSGSGGVGIVRCPPAGLSSRVGAVPDRALPSSRAAVSDHPERRVVLGRAQRLVLSALAVIVPFTFVGGAALDADASPNYGKVTVSGATHVRYSLTKRTCQSGIYIFEPGHPVWIALYSGWAGGRPKPYPRLGIAQLKAGPTHSINLAKTMDYSVDFGVNSHSWAAGYSTVSHEGSGTLSMSKNGKSGTISADLVAVDTATHGKVHVTANWHCP
jgi:hypothetical protein